MGLPCSTTAGTSIEASLLLMAAELTLGPTSRPGDKSVAAWSILMGGLASLATALLAILTFRPPRWLKPRWMLEREEASEIRQPVASPLDWLIVLLLGPPFLLLGVGAVGAAIFVAASP